MVDPRTSVINQRLSKIKRIVAVSSGKGGVGKSLVATTLALTLARQGCRVGLFDLDFTSPSTHIILNAPITAPKEDKGIVPPDVNNLKYMSLVYFSGEKPAPLRGADVSNALIELLAVTQWGSLDYLVIDMPPGIGDVILDLLRLISRVEFLIVTTPSMLAFETVKKQVALLSELNAKIIGLIENMKRTKSAKIEEEAQKLGLKYLAEIDFDSTVEDSIGDEVKLLNSSIGKAINQVVERDILEVEGCGKS
jgi:ATP-binding protein involved in chromosome partitioning